MFKSEDGAVTWRVVLDPEAVSEVTAVVADAALGAVYVGASEGLFASADGGETWHQLAPALLREVEAVAIDGHESHTLYVKARHGGVRGLWRSDDGGESWAEITPSLPLLQDFVVADPSRPGVLYAGSNLGVLKSTNGGESWSVLYRGLPCGRLGICFAESLAVDPGDPERLLAIVARRVYRSRDGGATWRRDGRWPDVVQAIAIHPEGLPVAFAGTPAGPYRRVGNGQWKRRVSGFTSSNIQVLATHPTRPEMVYAITEERLLGGGRLYQSRTSGRSWKPLSDGLFPDTASAMVFNPRRPRTLYVATFFRGGVWKSSDGGKTYKSAAAGIPSRRSRFGKLFAPLYSLAINPTNPNILYAGSDASVYKTTNGARQWHKRSEGIDATQVGALAIDHLSPETVYAATTFGVFKTTDGGQTWRASSRGLNQKYTEIVTIAVHPRRRNIVYALGISGVFKSTNSGNSWKRASRGLGASTTPRFYSAILIDPRNPRTLYVAVEGDAFDSKGGVYHTTNAGKTWKPINTGLTNTNVKALAINHDGSTLYAGTAGGGVFALRLR